jgi:inosose dehydratase
MKQQDRLNRRNFIEAGILVAAGLSATSRAQASSLPAADSPKSDPYRGLKFGVASYSLRNFSLDGAISIMKKLGVRYISLKDVHLPMESTPAQRKEARKKLEDAGLILMGGGVIYLRNDEVEIRNAFEYAKDAGMPTMVASPDPASLDLLDKMVQQYNIRVAIHNHGPGDEKYPSPLDVLRLVKNHDQRIGICADVGHTVRLGLDPIEAIKKCAGRLYDLHIKDVTSATADGENIEFGKGVIDIAKIIKTLLEIKFPYHVGLEYEINPDNPLPGMLECFAYARGVLAALG